MDGYVAAGYAAARQDLTQLRQRPRNQSVAEDGASGWDDRRADAGDERPRRLVVKSLNPTNLAGVIEADVILGASDGLECHEGVCDAGLRRVFTHQCVKIGVAEREASWIDEEEGIG